MIPKDRKWSSKSQQIFSKRNKRLYCHLFYKQLESKSATMVYWLQQLQVYWKRLHKAQNIFRLSIMPQILVFSSHQLSLQLFLTHKSKQKLPLSLCLHYLCTNEAKCMKFSTFKSTWFQHFTTLHLFRTVILMMSYDNAKWAGFDIGSGVKLVCGQKECTPDVII